MKYETQMIFFFEGRRGLHILTSRNTKVMLTVCLNCILYLGFDFEIWGQFALQSKLLPLNFMY